MVPAAGTLEAVAFAAYGLWLHNGHNVPDALTVVYRSHVSPVVRAAAGSEHTRVLGSRLAWDSYTVVFNGWLADE